MNDKKINELRIKVSRFRHPIKNLMIFSSIPFMFLSLLIMLPAFTGIVIITGNLAIEDIELLEEPDKTMISDAFLIIFPLYGYYIIGYLHLFIAWMILCMIDPAFSKSQSKRKKKNE